MARAPSACPDPALEPRLPQLAPPAAFRRLIAEGRHRAVAILLVAQRFGQVPVLARDNATRIICFRQAGNGLYVRMALLSILAGR